MYPTPTQEAIGIAPPKSVGLSRNGGVNASVLPTIVGLTRRIHTYIYIYIYIYINDIQFIE